MTEPVKKIHLYLLEILQFLNLIRLLIDIKQFRVLVKIDDQNMNDYITQMLLDTNMKKKLKTCIVTVLFTDLMEQTMM